MGEATRPKGMGPIADKLLADCRRSRPRRARSTYQPDELANGANGLLDEVASSKITGEEDRYSHTDLSDFLANVTGAQTTFGLLAPALKAKDPKLETDIAARFDAVQKELAHARPGRAVPELRHVDDAERQQLERARRRAGEADGADLGRARPVIARAGRARGCRGAGSLAAPAAARRGAAGRHRRAVPPGGRARTTPRSPPGCATETRLLARRSTRRYAKLAADACDADPRNPFQPVAAGRRGRPLARRGRAAGATRRSGAAATPPIRAELDGALAADAGGDDRAPRAALDAVALDAHARRRLGPTPRARRRSGRRVRMLTALDRGTGARHTDAVARRAQRGRAGQRRRHASATAPSSPTRRSSSSARAWRRC